MGLTLNSLCEQLLTPGNGLKKGEKMIVVKQENQIQTFEQYAVRGGRVI